MREPATPSLRASPGERRSPELAAQVARTSDRECDKHGDRRTREQKEFEHFCKPCYRELCHQPRQGLEALLEDIDTADSSREQFLERYVEMVEGERDPADSRE